jgi:hypothetical protein
VFPNSPLSHPGPPLFLSPKRKEKGNYILHNVDSSFFIIGLIPDKQISGEQVASPYLRFAFTSFILAIELLL